MFRPSWGCGRRAFPLVCALVVLAGCGGGGDAGDGTQDVRREDLAAMVLPQRDLGSLASGLALDQDSGRTDNRKAAEETFDRRDTGSSLARAGRVEGYRATYTRAANSRGRSQMGVLVSTEVELFRDEEGASAYLEKQMNDLEGLRGKTVEGARFIETEAFEGEAVGEEARGLTATFLAGETPVFLKLVAFRRDRLVGSALVLLDRERELSGELQQIARALDDRIQGVATGEIKEDAVSLPPPTKQKADATVARKDKAQPTRKLGRAKAQRNAGSRAVHKAASGLAIYEVRPAGFSVGIPSDWTPITRKYAASAAAQRVARESPATAQFLSVFTMPNSLVPFGAFEYEPDVGLNSLMTVMALPLKAGHDARELELGAIEGARAKAAPGSKIRVERLTFPAGRAVRIRLRTAHVVEGRALPGIAVMYLVQTREKVYILGYETHPKHADDYAPIFDRSARSLRPL